MNATLAAERNLAVIRTLMERSATYRRALGPIFLVAGLVGCIAALGGALLRVEHAFVPFWFGAAGLAVVVAFLMTRRQALRDKEPLWSAPTRRVAQALAPPLVAGAALTVVGSAGRWGGGGLLVVALWQVLYGCALHATGCLTPRAVRWLGWAFLAAGVGTLAGETLGRVSVTPGLLHAWMGATFGGFHLLCGLYLGVTQKGSNAA
jgi:hypothetical protein